MALDLFKDVLPSINMKLGNIIDNNPEIESEYQPFIVNKAYGFGGDTILFANMMNRYPNIDKKLNYDFYYYGLDKKKRFNKWLKPEEFDKLALVKEYYGYSDKKAKEALRILTDDDIKEIEKRLDKGGIKK